MQREKDRQREKERERVKAQEIWRCCYRDCKVLFIPLQFYCVRRWKSAIQTIARSLLICVCICRRHLRFILLFAIVNANSFIPFQLFIFLSPPSVHQSKPIKLRAYSFNLIRLLWRVVRDHLLDGAVTCNSTRSIRRSSLCMCAHIYIYVYQRDSKRSIECKWVSEWVNVWAHKDQMGSDLIASNT